MEIQEKIQKIDDLLKLMPLHRQSLFQIKYLVIGQESTWQGKMRQCILELQAKKEDIYNYTDQIENNKDKMSLLNLKLKCLLETEEDQIKKRIINRKINKIERTISNLEDKFNSVMEEIDYYLVIFNAINQHEKFKNFDDEEVQKEYWGNKFAEELNLRSLLEVGITPEMAKLVLALPDDIKIKKILVNTLEKKQIMVKEANGK